MVELHKGKIILSGYFSLPDLFVNKDNYLQKEIRDLVYDGKWRYLYKKQREFELEFENFEGPRELPGNKKGNQFWRQILSDGFWLPFCYSSLDNVNVLFEGCDNRAFEPLLRKISTSREFPSRFSIRIFPVGGFSIHMETAFNFNESTANEEYLTVQDLRDLSCEFFDCVRVSLSRENRMIEKNQKVTELFEEFGNRIRKKFLAIPGSEYSPMIRHVLVELENFEGSWSTEDIINVCGINASPKTSFKTLKKGYGLGTLQRSPPRENDVNFSGNESTLVCMKGMQNGKSWAHAICDAVEYTYLRKVILNDYDYFIRQNCTQIKDRISRGIISVFRGKYGRKSISWINDRFLQNLDLFINTDERINGNSPFVDDVVFKLLKISGYAETLKDLKRTLDESRAATLYYNEYLSERINKSLDIVERILAILPWEKLMGI